MGSALWFFDPNYNSGEGKWCNFEWGNFENNTGWGFWDTVKTGQFAGLWIFNRNLGEHPCAGGDLESKISGLNFSLNGAVGAPQTTVLFKKDLGLLITHLTTQWGVHFGSLIRIIIVVKENGVILNGVTLKIILVGVFGILLKQGNLQDFGFLIET
jgi:hypothetical protein